VMRRGGKVEDIRWFKNDASFVSHPMTVYNVGDIIACDVSEYGQAPLFLNVDGSAGDSEKRNATLNLWALDLGANTDGYKVQTLDDVSCEFGRLDERFSGLSYRFGHMLCDATAKSEVGTFNNIAKVDHQIGKHDTFEMRAYMGGSEAIFVPKLDSAAEEESHLLSNV